MNVGSRPVDRVHVVVPARDEADQLPDCLSALVAAREHAWSRWPGLRITLTLVLDSCVDGSGDVVRRHESIDVLEVALGRVGAVRAAGVEHSTSQVGPEEARRTWLMCTDADSVVPREWIAAHVGLARRADLVTGTVRPGNRDLTSKVRQAWLARHVLSDHHAHVHGAHLGVRLADYRRVGGFRPLTTGEDVDLVSRLRSVGARQLATAEVPVTTSARTKGRAPAGFAAYLLALAGGLEG